MTSSESREKINAQARSRYASDPNGKEKNRIKMQKYRAKHAEANRAYMREYRQKNLEKMRAQGRARIAADPDSAKKTREYHAKNKDIIRENARAKRRADPEKYRSWGRGRIRKKHKHTYKDRARQTVYYAIKSGRLKRPLICSVCARDPGKGSDGRPLIHAHHHKGYSEENCLDVKWLCSWCHPKAEAEIPK